MGRSKSKKRKAARRDFSNRRLPTFDTFDRELDRMVGLPDFYQQNIQEDYLPSEYFSQGRSYAPIQVGGLPIPEPTPVVPLQKVFLSPAELSAQEKPMEVFQDPTDECVRRAQREEVLHALQKTGKAGQKSPIWTEKSKIKC